MSTEPTHAVEQHAAVAVELHRLAVHAVAERDFAELLRPPAIGDRRLAFGHRVRCGAVVERIERVVRVRGRRNERIVRQPDRRGPAECCIARGRVFTFTLRNLCFEFARARELIGALQPHERRLRVDVQRIALEPILVDAAEHRGKPIELALRDRVVLVVVAARAFEREPEERSAKRRNTVGDALLPELLRNRAAFLGHAMQPMERGCDAVVDRRVRQQVAGDDARDELVERHVRAQRTQQPVAPRPRAHLAVRLVAVGVGIAREVEPGRRHVLRCGIAVEQRCDATFVFLLRRVRGERIRILGRWRQTGDRERSAAQQLCGLGARRRREPARFEVLEHMRVERIDGPRRIADHWRELLLRRDEGPMRRVFATARNPRAQRRLLGLGQRPLVLGRRHHLVVIVREDATHQFARIDIERHDRARPGLHLRHSAFREIEPQPRLARALIRPVARKATVREDRPHIAREVDALRITRWLAPRTARARDSDGDGREQRDGELHGQRRIARRRRPDVRTALTPLRAGRRPRTSATTAR